MIFCLINFQFFCFKDQINSTAIFCSNPISREKCEEQNCIFSIHIESGCGQCACERQAGPNNWCPTPMCARGCDLVYAPDQCPTCKCRKQSTVIVEEKKEEGNSNQTDEYREKQNEVEGSGEKEELHGKNEEKLLEILDEK